MGHMGSKENIFCIFRDVGKVLAGTFCCVFRVYNICEVEAARERPFRPDGFDKVFQAHCFIVVTHCGETESGDNKF